MAVKCTMSDPRGDRGDQDNLPVVRGAGTIFFLGGGGKHIDMPSDCQNLGGGAQAYPSH